MIKLMRRRESAWGIRPAKAAEDGNSEAARPGWDGAAPRSLPLGVQTRAPSRWPGTVC